MKTNSRNTVWRLVTVAWMACAIAPGFGVSPAQAQRVGGGAGPREVGGSPTANALARYDLNHDGVLSAEEKAVYRRDIVQKLEPMRRAALRQFDLNHNGVLDPDEKRAEREARQAQHVRSEARALERYDANGNGVLDADEQARRTAAREAWLQTKKSQAIRAYDSNHDGVLDEGEKVAMHQSVESSRQKALDRFDANHDGTLDPAERAVAVDPSNPRGVAAGAGGTAAANPGTSISAAAGGIAVAEGGAARLSLPAGALRADGKVAVIAAAAASQAAHGGRRSLRVVDVRWGSATLLKAGTLEIAMPDGAAPATAEAVISRWTGSEWIDLPSRLFGGGMTATITEPGRYALLAAARATAGSPTLSAVRVAPSSGSRYSKGAEISFALGMAGTVSVKVYDTAGRMIRSVASGTAFDAGEHTLRWDGGGADGGQVSNGLYMISLEAFGQKVTRKIPILR